MSILAQIIGLACLLFWGSGFAASCGCPPGLPRCAGCALHGSAAAGWQLQPALAGGPAAACGAVLTLAQRRRHEILPQLLSPGVLAFCSAAGVLMAVFAIRQPEFQTWDEFSHWGIYFKSVFYQHRFAVWDTTRSLAHQAYPQGLPGLYALLRCPPPNTGNRMYCLSLRCRWLQRLLPCLPCRRSQPAARASLILSAPAWPHRRCFGGLPRYPLYDCLYGRPGGRPVCCGVLCYPAALCC